MKTKPKTDNYASQTFTKVLPYLYRNGAGMYYGRKRHEGKTHKRSLDTEDFEKAKRELKTFLGEIEDKSDEKPDAKFEEVSKQWVASLYDLKPSSKLRRETSLKSITPAFAGQEMRSITKKALTEWAPFVNVQALRAFFRSEKCLRQFNCFLCFRHSNSVLSGHWPQ